MEHKTKSIRPFIGAKDYDQSRRFYRDLGFEEVILSPAMSLFKTGAFGFYLQNAYVQDWVDNTQVFWEMENVDDFLGALQGLDLPAKYPGVRLVPIREQDWGREFFLHDPSGILWHIGAFAQ